MFPPEMGTTPPNPPIFQIGLSPFAKHPQVPPGRGFWGAGADPSKAPRHR